VRSSILLCLAALLCAAARAAPIVAPDSWRAESFKFPLIFAPSIPFEGEESVRFSPSWSRFGQSDGFTYVFLWDLKPIPVEAAHLERALAVYFDGLMTNAARGRKLEELPVPAAVVLHPLRAPQGWEDAYAGSIYTWNAFNRGEELKINLEITYRLCAPDHMQVFFGASKAERRDAVWNTLREIRTKTPCTKTGDGVELQQAKPPPGS
jgi:hypothetical protein